MPIAHQKINARCAGLLLLAFLLIAAPRMLYAQADTTADKSVDVSIFGGYQYMNPDIGRASDRGNGVTGGIDLTLYCDCPVTPSIEVRGSYAKASSASESTLLYGVRFETGLRHRLHPYGDFLVGVGRIVFTRPPAPGYTQDKGPVFSYGGGVNIDLSRSFAAMIDFQGQDWNMGQSPSVTSNPKADFTLAPLALVIGINYRIPFHH